MEAAMSREYDRGLMYAEACFETFRVIDGEIFRWPLHEQRLAAGLNAFGLTLPEGLHARCLAEAKACASDVLLRLTVTGGDAPWGFAPPEERHPCVHIQAMPYTLPEGEACLRSVTWPFPLIPRPAKFTTDYAMTLRALHMLRNYFPGGETALICDAEYLYSGITANLLIYRQGMWWTPDHRGALPGVVRAALIEAEVVRAAACPRSWLADCEAMALSSSGSFIRPVASVDRRSLMTDEALFAPLWKALAGEPGVPVEMGRC